MNTKSQSLNKTMASKCAAYSMIKKALAVSPKSRAELSKATGLKLSSICGRCNELLKSGDIIVAGKTYDEATERNVQTLKINTKLSVREEIVVGLRDPSQVAV